MANEIYTAILMDRPGGTEKAHYPGLFPNEDGTVPNRILVRYSDQLAESRVVTYTLGGDEFQNDEEHRIYFEQSDEPYSPGKPDEADWLIDAPGDRP